MAANYWASTQYQFWLFTPAKLAEARDEIKSVDAKAIEQHPFPDRRLMMIFIRDRILQLAKRLQFRQQCVATALVYIHRYLISTSLQSINLYLLVATAFYLASKTDESPHHIRMVSSEARQAWPEYMTGDVTRIGEMEFSLISEMQSRLIVWHPYRTLEEFKQDPRLKISSDNAALAWSIINDTYLTDLPLTYPPHIIAVTAIFIAIAFLPPRPSVIGHHFTEDQDVTVDDRFPSLGGRAGLGALAKARAQDTIGRIQNQHLLPQSGHLSTSNPTQGSNGTSGPNVANGMNSSTPIDPTATVLSSEKVRIFIEFLATSELKIEDMIEVTQEIISLYEVWDQYNEKIIRETVARCLKNRGLDT